MDKRSAVQTSVIILEYLSKLKELSILPIKTKFALNDLILFYKIINSLVPINFPEHFTIIKPEDVRLTRKLLLF